jgi:hypothetical protein
MRIVRLCGWGALAFVAAALQGYVIFWFFDLGGSFLSRTGFGCTAGVALVEAVVVALAILKADEMHGSLTSNPHSPLGQSLRSKGTPPPAPPAARSAWDGDWEHPSEASGKMGSER